MTTNQEGLHATVRALTSTTRSYNEDWHALFDADGIAAGPFNARMLAWINATLGTSYTNLTGAMQAFAVDQGFANWASMNTFAAYSAEATALFAAMSVQPSAARKDKYDALIVALKDAGIWSKLDILYVAAAHDEQAGRLNLKAPASFALTGSPTFTTDQGFTGDGLATYLSTGWDASTAGGNYAQNSAHLGLWLTTNVAETRWDGSGNGGRTLLQARTASDQILARINDTVTLTITGQTDARGHVVANRSGASARQVYKDGASVGSDTQASGALLTGNFELLRYTTSYSTKRVAAAHAGGSLTAGEVSALYSALLDFFTV